MNSVRGSPHLARKLACLAGEPQARGQSPGRGAQVAAAGPRRLPGGAGGAGGFLAAEGKEGGKAGGRRGGYLPAGLGVPAGQRSQGACLAPRHPSPAV